MNERQHRRTVHRKSWAYNGLDLCAVDYTESWWRGDLSRKGKEVLL